MVFSIAHSEVLFRVQKVEWKVQEVGFLMYFLVAIWLTTYLKLGGY